VVQVVDHGCCCCGSIWKIKHSREHGASWYRWGRREESTGIGSCVTDRQGNGPVEDALSNAREDWPDANHFVIVVPVFALSVVRAIFVGVAGGEIEMHARLAC
jgi:hypothetical protein